MKQKAQTERGGGIKPALRKLFIIYLAFVTGCSNTTQNLQQGHVSSVGADQAIASQKTDIRQGITLPELGGAKPTEQVSKEAFDQLMKGAPASDQMQVANPRAAGYGSMTEFQSMAMGMANSAMANAMQGWFGERKVTAEVNISAGEKGVRSGSIDLLVPVYDKEKDLVFIQGGVRRSNQYTESARTTTNIGIGYRKTMGEWLFGTNAFYDRDLTGRNDRIGLGVEAWSDNVKLAANSYHRLSDWKKSPDMKDYLERPANGWDVRAEAFLPSHPQLGGKVMFEQYYGDEVGLFGSSSRQKNPSAATVGVMYTPVPLLNIGADYKRGQDGLSQTSFRVGLNFQVGVPLAKQLSPASVISARKLENARYNLVSRNNEIVLDYRKDDDGQIRLPAVTRGTPTATVSFPVTLTNGSIRNITWSGSAAAFALPYNGSGLGSVVMPALDPVGTNTYTLQATGTGPSGAPVTSNMMIITVDAMVIALQRSKPIAMADGSDAVTFTATLKRPTGEPEAYSDIQWAVTGSASITSQEDKTDSAGRARISLVSMSATTVQVTATEPTGSQADAGADFTGDATSARVIALTATPAVVTANGSDSSTLTASVVDVAGNPVGAGVLVSWSSTIGNVATSSSTTNASGKATTTLTGTVQGIDTVTATAVMGGTNTNVTFTADSWTAQVVGVTASPTIIAANGTTSSTLSATVQDAQGNPVGAGINVNWSTSLGDLAAASSATDASGKATTTLTGTLSGTATVTAAAVAGSASTGVVLIPDHGTAQVISLVAAPAVIAADGTSASTLTATVRDAHGNPVGAGVPITWSTTLGTLAAASSVTDTSARATMTLTGTQAGDATVTASAAAGSSTATVTITSDDASARVVGVVATPAIIAANGSTASTLVASVEDAQGNPVGAGVTVNWVTTLGDLGAASSTTDASGKAMTTLAGTQAGPATVTAAAVGGSAATGVTFIPDHATARVISLAASPAIIAANGVAASTLTAVIQDVYGNAVGAGVPITWSTTLGDLAAASSITDASGRSTMTLTGTQMGSASVTATAAAGSSAAIVTLTADPATARVISLVATPATITANGSDTSTLVATVQDAQGNSVGAGVSISWAASLGNLAAASSTTDASGQASVTLSGTQAGASTVTATAPAGSSNALVTLEADASTARVVGVTASPSSIPANGTSASTLTATVVDRHGNALGAGLPVTWSTTSGTLSAVSSTTNSSGRSSIALISSTTVGAATVTATAEAGAANTVVTFANPAPVISSFGVGVGNYSCSGDWVIYDVRWVVSGAVTYAVEDATRGRLLWSGSSAPSSINGPVNNQPAAGSVIRFTAFGPSGASSSVSATLTTMSESCSG